MVNWSLTEEQKAIREFEGAGNKADTPDITGQLRRNSQCFCFL